MGSAVQPIMVRLAKHFASAALLVAAVAAPAVSQTGTTPASNVPASAASKAQSSAAPKASAATTATHPRTHRKKKAEPVAQVPQTPPPPPTLDQQPPAAPQVSYRDGLLTINAPNSTLSSVLRAVQSQTGATMDVPSSASSDRIAMAIGPGQPKDVLHTLLNGSTYDYVILGVAGHPGAVQRVILTPKTAGGATNQAANTPPPAEEPVDDSSGDSGGESEYPGPQAPVPPGAFRRPMGAPGGQAYQQEQQQQDQSQQNPFPQGESDNVVKTPEQLMQELQQMQQQQQQYQEQLNPANQPPQ